MAILKRENLFLLYSFLGSLILSVVLFHVVSRFRLPVTPFFILFSAYAVGRAINWIKQREIKSFGLATIIFFIFLYGFKIPENQVVIRYVDYCNWSLGYYGLGKKWFDLEKAEKFDEEGNIIFPTKANLDKTLPKDEKGKTTWNYK